ncbi:MAG: hypothetical protein ABIY70_10870 [Capsulimonas sp.]|uniref:hypothetical protein n=1 Tax=Capsulimonas sp. TaxID=2494211 RepID=UPI003265995A
MNEFLWRPGHGPDADAIERMTDYFPKPSFPMGEAWFMTDKRKIYSELMTTAPDDLPLENLIKYLDEIGSGTSAFGKLDGEWSDWLHYLLPILAAKAGGRTSNGALATDVISAFVTQYPNDVSDSYPDFRMDVLNTLGRWPMGAQFWDGDDLRPGTVLPGPPLEGQQIHWWETDSDVSAVMFFLWKYLKPVEIDSWVGSVFAIKGAHWNANLLVWLVGARNVLSGKITQPVEFDTRIPKIGWFTTYYLNGRYDGDYQTPTTIPFLSQANIIAFQVALRKHITEELFFEWLDAFTEFDYLKNELYTLPDQFAAAYLER